MANLSCVRVKQYSQSNVGACWRHVERKNENYGNVNVDVSRIPMNIHYKTPCGTYSGILQQQVDDGKISLRGLREDAKMFDELVIDVNSRYFEESGGFEYAKRFYADVYKFAEKLYGTDNILSAVLHADEINKALTEEYGHPVYHYHIHIVALPVVDKEIKWTKRCKDPTLVGTVKEVVHQVSHAKKWESKPTLDKNGKPMRTKKGKLKLVPSYRVLQDDFVAHMRACGYSDFERGQMGSTTEHLENIEYQVQQERKRLEAIRGEVRVEQVRNTYSDVEMQDVEKLCKTGKRTIIGKVQLEQSDYERLTDLSKEAVSNGAVIRQLTERCKAYMKKIKQLQTRLDAVERLYEALKATCALFLYALEHLPELVNAFVAEVKRHIEQQEREKDTGKDAKAKKDER